jgi:hypothetical protein
MGVATRRGVLRSPRPSAIQGTSQTSDARPNTRNPARQPNWAIIKPPTSVPKAGPVARPAPTRPFAAPSFSGGRFSASSFDMQGKAPPSPSPSRKRSSRSSVNPLATPVSTVASDHSATDQPSSTTALDRAMSQPISNCTGE